MEEFTNTLTAEERETHFSQTADDRSVWHVFSDDPVWIGRLAKLGIDGKRVGFGMEYTFSTDEFYITVRAKRKISATEKARLVARLAKAT